MVDEDSYSKAVNELRVVLPRFGPGHQIYDEIVAMGKVFDAREYLSLALVVEVGFIDFVGRVRQKIKNMV